MDRPAAIKRIPRFGFSEPKTTAAAFKVIKETYQVTGEVLNGTLRSGTQPACDLGCHWCCFLRVKVTPLEVLTIADFMRIWWGLDEASAFRQRLAVADATTRGMNGIERVRAKIECPLLQDGMCSVYPVRPIACRFYHSLNLADCEALLDDEVRSVTVRNDIAALGMGVFAGLTEGLRVVGLRPRLLELNASLRLIMDEPDLGCRWLAGEPAFAEAEIAEAATVEDSHRLLVEALTEQWNSESGEN